MLLGRQLKTCFHAGFGLEISDVAPYDQNRSNGPDMTQFESSDVAAVKI
jgi:hypothetical protein